MFVTHLLSIITVKNILIKTALQEYYDEGIEMICTDSLKRYCYLILADIMVDYEEQVLIIGIKTNMQYFICYIPP